MDHPDSTEEIPTIDIGPCLSGEPGAHARIAAELRQVTETIGFFYLENHGVAPTLFDRMFAQSKRFFALPIEEKRRIPRVDNTGYVEMKDLGDGGKPKMVALVAVARKLLTILNAILQDKQPWNPKTA